MTSILDKIALLKGVSLFRDLSHEALAELAMVLDEQNVPAGQDVVVRGNMGNSLFILVEGRVSVHVDEGGEIAIIEARDFFGEFAALVSEMRLATVTTLEDSKLFILEQAHLFSLMQQNREVLTGVIATLVNRMRARLENGAERQASLLRLALK